MVGFEPSDAWRHRASQQCDLHRGIYAVRAFVSTSTPDAAAQDRPLRQPATLAHVYALIPLPFLFASVFFLLRAETAQPRDVRAVRLWKPAATALVIAMCLLAFLGRNAPVYTGLIALGLAFCFAGDVYLIDGDRPDMFARGLASFLLGHIVFIGALSQIQNLRGMALNLERELV